MFVCSFIRVLFQSLVNLCSCSDGLCTLECCSFERKASIRNIKDKIIEEDDDDDDMDDKRG